MAGSKRTCVICGSGFIGRSSARFCSGACRKRAQRARGAAKCDTAVTVKAPPVRAARRSAAARSTTPVRSAQAQAVLGSLDDELAFAGQARGQSLKWTAQELALLDLIADSIDRTVDLYAMYERAADDDVTMRIKLSAELRLSQQSTQRLLRQIKTDVPAKPSFRTVKARRAANARWHRHEDGDDASG
jgi:hypothetical protein